MCTDTKKNQIVVDITNTHDQVTGSCNLVIVRLPIPDGNGNDVTVKKFIVDCGLFQGQDDEDDLNSKDFPFASDEIEFALITHHHVDHYGRFPLLIKRGYNGPIITTLPTKKFLTIGLNDCINVTNKNAKRNHISPLYDEEDVSETLRHIEGYEFNQEVYFDENFSICFFKNGHLPGAAVILVKISCENADPVYYVFSGDYCDKNMFFEVPDLPDWVKELPVHIICESTYGDIDTTDLEEPCFDKIIEKSIKDHKTILLPVFSLGRAQEVLLTLKNMQDAGKLPLNVRIYLDGYTSQAYTILYRAGNIFEMFPYAVKFLPVNLRYVVKKKEPKIDPYPPSKRPNKKKKKHRVAQPNHLPKKVKYSPEDNLLDTIPDDLKVEREDVINDTHRKIIISSSGSASYGPSQTYVQKGINRDNYVILFTGYIFPDSHGKVAIDAEIGTVISLGGVLTIKRAQTFFTGQFSKHAKGDELLRFLKGFKNPKVIFINHGEPKTRQIFAERVDKEFPNADVVVLNSSTIVRINNKGIEKQYPA